MRSSIASAAAVGGGALIVAGALLPWLSLFAGLQSYSGMIGLYGRLVFAGGALAIAGGLVTLVHPLPGLRPGVGALGVVLALFTSWLLLGLRSTTRMLDEHPTLIARPGPGLFVALAGALIVAATLWPERRRDASARRDRERDRVRRPMDRMEVPRC